MTKQQFCFCLSNFLSCFAYYSFTYTDISQANEIIEKNLEIKQKTKGTGRCNAAFISEVLLNKHDLKKKKRKENSFKSTKAK